MLFRSGCSDPDLLMKAFSEDIDGIDFDDNFSPDEEQKNMVIEKWRKEKPNLFAKSAPQIGSHKIKAGEHGDGKTKSLSKMSMDELMTMWASAEKTKA